MKKTIISVIFILAPLLLSAQYSYNTEEYKPKKNLLKVNITGLLIKNYPVQFERVISKRFSVALSYRNMPEGKLPLKDHILKRVDNIEESTEKLLNDINIGNYALTPELRFYFGKKGYGRGFYISPFYRNAKYSGTNLIFDYEDENNDNQTVTLSGNIKSQTLGLMIGAQWSLSKFFVLDWWILGPHIGKGIGELDALSTRTLSAEEQNHLKQELEKIEVPILEKSVTTRDNGATLSLKGPWAGLRAGISLGIKF